MYVLILKDDDTVSELSAAPTDIYASPTRTPRSLSQLDLTLKVDATPYELNKHMERMMLHTTGIGLKNKYSTLTLSVWGSSLYV